jgi:TrmH family RNA methyltransferase
MLPEPITSPANPRVREAAALRDAAARRGTGLTLVDGRRELVRAAAAGAPIVEVFATTEALAAAEVRSWLDGLGRGGARITPLGERAFARIAFGGRDEGVVGVVRFAARRLADVPLPPDRPVLVVEGIEKPGNLGAILRTVDAAGLGGLVACDPRTDPANPATIRASLGTVFGVALATATTPEALEWCATQRRRVVAATPDGARPWHEADLTGGVALLLGSEAHGLSTAWHDAAATGTITLESVRLPMRGRADSLNVSATAAVLAYESLRQESMQR